MRFESSIETRPHMFSAKSDPLENTVPLIETFSVDFHPFQLSNDLGSQKMLTEYINNSKHRTQNAEISSDYFTRHLSQSSVKISKQAINHSFFPRTVDSVTTGVVNITTPIDSTMTQLDNITILVDSTIKQLDNNVHRQQ